MEKKFDKEYGTQWDKEVSFLKDRNINPTFVRTGMDSVRTYKYTKTASLFGALNEFYSM